MIRHRLLLVVVGILGINISHTLAKVTQLNLTITPEHIHIKPGTDYNILCKADVPLTNCEFKVFNHQVYDLSEGYLSETDTGFSYFGEGLENGDCGATIHGMNKDSKVFVVGCRARSRTSDWAFAEIASINKARDELEVTVTPSRTLTILPGEPIRVLADAKVPLSQCTFVLTNDFSRSNDNRRFNFYPNATAGPLNTTKNRKPTTNPVGTSMEYYGQGVNEGQCGFQVLKAKEELNGGAWIDLIDADDREETVFIRLIVARSPNKLTLLYNTTENVDGSIQLNAWCSVKSRPAATLSWYLGGKRIPDDFLEYIPTTDWKWPSNIQTVKQKLSIRLNASDDGKELWCSAEHIALVGTRESERVKIEIPSGTMNMIVVLGVVVAILVTGIVGFCIYAWYFSIFCFSQPATRADCHAQIGMSKLLEYDQ